jgi:hypothetical protein
MNFTLTYDGKLKTNGDSRHKHEIRRVFHRQLAELWKASPLFRHGGPDKALTKAIGNYKFFPLTSSAREEVAELRITMLRPQIGPGYIIGEGGDIDNRLKTLFDSLRMPDKKDELPKGEQPAESENPFFCLLENDILITSLSVRTDRLLEPAQSNSYVKLVIEVLVKKVPMVGANMITRLG